MHPGEHARYQQVRLVGKDMRYQQARLVDNGHF
jgi:hypothetical protein